MQNEQKLFGFIEGILKERDFLNGEFNDRYLLAILKKDWLKLQNNAKVK